MKWQTLPGYKIQIEYFDNQKNLNGFLSEQESSNILDILFQFSGSIHLWTVVYQVKL